MSSFGGLVDDKAGIKILPLKISFLKKKIQDSSVVWMQKALGVL